MPATRQVTMPMASGPSSRASSAMTAPALGRACACPPREPAQHQPKAAQQGQAGVSRVEAAIDEGARDDAAVGHEEIVEPVGGVERPPAASANRTWCARALGRHSEREPEDAPVGEQPHEAAPRRLRIHADRASIANAEGVSCLAPVGVVQPGRREREPAPRPMPRRGRPGRKPAREISSARAPSGARSGGTCPTRRAGRRSPRTARLPAAGDCCRAAGARGARPPAGAKGGPLPTPARRARAWGRPRRSVGTRDGQVRPPPSGRARPARVRQVHPRN